MASLSLHAEQCDWDLLVKKLGVRRRYSQRIAAAVNDKIGIERPSRANRTFGRVPDDSLGDYENALFGPSISRT